MTKLPQMRVCEWCFMQDVGEIPTLIRVDYRTLVVCPDCNAVLENNGVKTYENGYPYQIVLTPNQVGIGLVVLFILAMIIVALVSRQNH